LSGTSYSVTETVPTNWISTRALVREAEDLLDVHSANNNGITVESGKLTTCTFTDSKKPSLAVVKDNDATRDSAFNDTETVPADVTYPYTVTYKGTITNSSLSSATLSSITDDKKAAPLSLTANTTAPKVLRAASRSSEPRSVLGQR
jgi:hypothetical protein